MKNDKRRNYRNLLTGLIDTIDNGSQRDLDKADEICISGYLQSQGKVNR